MPVDSARRKFAKRAIDAAVRKALDSYDPEVGELIRRVQGRSTLLSPASYAGREDVGLVDQIARGLAALALRRDDWIRPVDTWIASGRTAVAAFSTLAHHLLARYPVPAVLLSSWFRGVGEEARRVQDWYRHVGRGGSLRTAGFFAGAHEAGGPSLRSRPVGPLDRGCAPLVARPEPGRQRRARPIRGLDPPGA